MNTKIQLYQDFKFESVRCSPDPTTNSKLFVYNLTNEMILLSASKLEKIDENELQNSLLDPVKRQKRQKLSHEYVFFHQFYHI